MDQCRACAKAALVALAAAEAAAATPARCSFFTLQFHWQQMVPSNDDE